MSTSLQNQMNDLGLAARQASREIARASAAQKKQTLLALARLLREEEGQLLAANQIDLAQAQAHGVSGPLFDRLKLNSSVLQTCALGCEQLALMPDIVGEIVGLREQPSGIRVGQMRVPIGVFGMIYESRPNVTIEAASLSIKSGNACILRGGSEAIESNKALALLVQKALTLNGLPRATVQLIQTTDRDAVGMLIRSPQWGDVIIPRGGKGLIARITEEAKVPVIKHLDGNCHTYVDDLQEQEMYLKVIENAKTQKYSPCNALESLLIKEDLAREFLPKMAAILWSHGVELRVCERAYGLLSVVSHKEGLLVKATEQDWFEEYLAPILSIKLVRDLNEAIEHINHYSSHHTDAILTQNHVHAQRFLREVDSASVMINTSTRFADGFEFGLGAEIGISTDKFHARGPVGVEGLTSLKYIVLGQGEVRA